MNVKQITKALHTLSLLSDEDYDLVLKLRALTEDEREQFRTALELQKPAAKKATTTTRTYVRCSQCNKTKGHAFHKDSSNDGYHVFQSPPSSKPSPSKSPRASSLSSQLKSRTSEQREAATKDITGESDERCMFTDDDGPCGYPPDSNIHHLSTHPDYHPFKSSVPDVPTRSPANGGATSGIQNSAVEKVAAGAATGGSSE